MSIPANNFSNQLLTYFCARFKTIIKFHFDETVVIFSTYLGNYTFYYYFNNLGYKLQVLNFFMASSF